ncbi:rhodanese-like domain-containing protein [Streptomyces sp. NL15-2K]|uniref:rhodanese-like domain-containing protein n=1 Tax=Streptomyces sp. NL15-2K TaxID=376149 RepID=UPI000F55F281|nr:MULTISPECIES: rhodanese-like domain-containing protein [Actinomycetes]WKX13997.1 rhodanese-like domain-containing protein [Kutzneria buriramensis]GCB50807.1 rhodanese-related sulfurtransferase [Streptomyces sp. NL15-2K]
MSPFLRRGPDRLSPEQAHRQIADGQAVLLDVRETPEWNSGHAPGALHLPLSRLMAGAPLPDAVQGRRVVTICRSGNRSRTAADMLTAAGVEATDVTAGMTAWARQGLPVIGVNGSGGVIE